MRVVSLVPSLTEAVAVSAPGLLVGATDYCTHPPDLDVARVGGSKYPDLDRIRALKPDLVLMNVEENRRSDAEALRADGIATHVTYPHSVNEALAELQLLLTALGLPGEPGWLAAARAAWARVTPVQPQQAVIPVWRRPWIVAGGDTFTTDVLRRLGVANVYADHPNRYPRPALDDIHATRPTLIVLPDEPYRFTADDGPEAFPDTPCALVSGRHLTWYGPSLADAPTLLTAQLVAAR